MFTPLRFSTRPAISWGAFGLLWLLCLPVSAQVSAPTAAAIAVMPDSYRLTPGDAMMISVLGHTDFNQSATISPDGFLYYTGVGKVQAAGLNVDQLTEVLTARLHRQIRRPLVSVSLTETHPRPINVVGQGVRLPGTYKWHPGMPLLEAIADAGGLVQAPELTDTLLMSGSDVQTVDMVKLIEQGEQTLNVPLQPGDTLLMSPRDPAKANVQVTGQVVHPGPFAVPPSGATIVSVLNLAGGALPNAAYSRVQVQHGTQTQTVNLHPLLFDLAAPVGQTRLVAGDVVHVPLNDTHVDVFGEVYKPGEYPMPDGEPLTITRLLAQCNPTRDADQRSVGIMRTLPNGRQQGIVVNTGDLIRQGKGVDVALQSGDRIIVAKRRAGFTGIGALQTTVGTLFGFRAIGSIFR